MLIIDLSSRQGCASLSQLGLAAKAELFFNRTLYMLSPPVDRSLTWELGERRRRFDLDSQPDRVIRLRHPDEGQKAW